MKKVALNKSERLTRNEMIAQGLKTHCPKASIPDDGQTVKAADAIKVFEDATAAEKKAIASRAQYLLDVAAARAAEKKAKALVAPVKGYVSALFGKKGTIAAQFGFGPQASTVSAEVRYEAVEKLRATRAARGTRGSRQKEAIHGEVPAPQPQPPQIVTTNGSNGTNGSTQSAVLSLNGTPH